MNKKKQLWPPPPPTHTYVLYAKCGCPVCVIADIPGWEKDTAAMIAKRMEPGDHIERLPNTEIGNIIRNLGCSCPKTEQLSMFARNITVASERL